MVNQLSKTEIDELICSHLSSALKFAIKLTGNPDSAEELVQNSLLKVSKNWNSFRKDSKFQTWLFQIMINTFRDQVAKNNRCTSLDEELSENDSEEPLDKLIHKETNQLLAEKISKLPLKQREVIILYVFEKFSVKEVSEALSITEKNVYSTLHIARGRLKEMMKPYLSETE